MEELKKLCARLENERPNAWEDFPDISLYMDQVMSYMPRQLIDLGETESLTSAMVNNYIKEGLLPRAEGKRYDKRHLAYLTAICALKQVITVRDAHRLIQAGETRAAQEQADRPSSEELPQLMYRYVCQELDAALNTTAASIDPETAPEDLSLLALRLALSSYTNRLACLRVLSILDPQEEKKGKKKKDKEK